MSVFIDTNVLVYSVSAATEDAPKRSVALALLAEADIHLSLQVVQEFIHTSFRKKRISMDPLALRICTRQLLTLPCHIPDAASVLKSLDLQQKHQVSYWDATSIASALELGCQTLYSEVLNHGQDYSGIKVINPFLETRPTAG